VKLGDFTALTLPTEGGVFHRKVAEGSNVHLSPEAEAYFERKGCEVVLKPTPEAIQMFNRSRAKRIGLFHVTC